MFGENMMDKLMAMQQQAESVKQNLENKLVSGDAGGGLVLIEMNGNRKLSKVEINTDLKSMEKEDLEDLLIVAFNRAIEKANVLQESEMDSNLKGLFPGV